MKKINFESMYSIAILIIIPALVVINTVLSASYVKNAYNRELSKRADIVNVAAARLATPLVETNKIDDLQVSLNALNDQSEELSRLLIVQKDNAGNIKTIARSNDAPPELSQNESLQYQLAWDRKAPIATLVNNPSANSQSWQVVTPIFDNKNNTLALMSSRLSTEDANEIIDNALVRSFIILAVTVLAIIALLLHHMRLAGYARLLAKQKEINQTMGDFLSVATHELKAPATIIKGYVSEVSEGNYGEITPDAKQQLQVALQQTDRLNNLVKDLLNVSRIEQGRIEYNLEPVNTQTILKPIVENYRHIAKDKGLELYFQPDENLPAIYADAGRVQEILTNLIDNAVKYTAEGSITIRQSLNGNFMVISIKDTGFGLTSEQRARLFQRFYRAQTPQTKDISGTGLGLWIIKQYVEFMGGKIEVDSLPGTGSEFSVWFLVSK